MESNSEKKTINYIPETIQQKEERSKACTMEIFEILKKYDCIIEPIGNISNKGIQMRINISCK